MFKTPLAQHQLTQLQHIMKAQYGVGQTHLLKVCNVATTTEPLQTIDNKKRSCCGASASIAMQGSTAGQLSHACTACKLIVLLDLMLWTSVKNKKHPSPRDREHSLVVRCCVSRQLAMNYPAVPTRR